MSGIFRIPEHPKNKCLKHIVFLIGVFFSLLVIPLISAYSYGGWGYSGSPLEYLQNQWVMFIIYVIFFFAIIFYTTNKSFKNPPISGVVAAALSLFIAIALAQRGWLDAYMGTAIGAWGLLVAALIAVGFAVKFSYETFGRIGSVAAILIIWFIIFSTDPQNILPQELLTDTFLGVYSFVASWIGLVVVLIISAVLITAQRQRSWTGMGDAFHRTFGR
jgi:hypothetical protein